MDHKLTSTPSDPHSCLLGAGNFFQPPSSRLTSQRELNEEIKYSDEMTKKKSNERVTDAQDIKTHKMITLTITSLGLRVTCSERDY